MNIYKSIYKIVMLTGLLLATITMSLTLMATPVWAGQGGPPVWANKGITPEWAGKGITPVWAGKGNGSSVTPLDQFEIDALTFMREEEKLARDVYLVMFDYWGADTFAKIAVSEQKHMDTMKKKLDKYGIPDSASPYEGVFNDPLLQGRYNDLIEDGANSLIDGLYVGATIEEIDMVDIQEAIDASKHVDLIVAYQNLLEGSKKHLRAYVNALARQNFIYEPQFISQELFEAIMDL